MRRGQGRYREALRLATQYADAARGYGDLAFVLLGQRILGLTQHFIGNQPIAQAILEEARAAGVRNPDAARIEFQLDSEVATTTMLARILWLRGYPDQAAATLQAGLEAARRTNHAFSESYVVCFAGCPLSLWLNDSRQTSLYLDILARNSSYNPPLALWRQCWDFILRLRGGGKREALVAAYWEPRLDYSTFIEIAALTSAANPALAEPNEDIGDALWRLPEILRVNAEIRLWKEGGDAAPVAEATLLRSLQIAQEQSALAWELRSATSLARLWRACGRAGEACRLLAGVCDKFSEGFGSHDVVTARQLLREWS